MFLTTAVFEQVTTSHIPFRNHLGVDQKMECAGFKKTQCVGAKLVYLCF